MSLPTGAALRYPWRGAEDAPAFTGRPGDLAHYFTDVEHLVETTAPTHTDRDLISRCVYYLDYHTADLWESIPAVTWEEFKREIRSLYPGATTTGAYRLKDLEHLVSTQSQSEITTVAALGEFLRQFVRIAADLKKNRRLGAYDESRMFMEAFAGSTGARIRQRLEILDPMHHPDDPYPVEDVRKAAEWILPAFAPRLERAQDATPKPTYNPTPQPITAPSPLPPTMPGPMPPTQPQTVPVYTYETVPPPPSPRPTITVSGTSPAPITVSGTSPASTGVVRTAQEPLQYYAAAHITEVEENSEEEEKTEKKQPEKPTYRDHGDDLRRARQSMMMKYAAVANPSKNRASRDVPATTVEDAEESDEEEREEEDEEELDEDEEDETPDVEDPYSPEYLCAVYLSEATGTRAQPPEPAGGMERMAELSLDEHWRWQEMTSKACVEYLHSRFPCSRASPDGRASAPTRQLTEFVGWHPWDPG